jgi:hypothetical protein
MEGSLFIDVMAKCTDLIFKLKSEFLGQLSKQMKTLPFGLQFVGTKLVALIQFIYYLLKIVVLSRCCSQYFQPCYFFPLLFHSMFGTASSFIPGRVTLYFYCRLFSSFIPGRDRFYFLRYDGREKRRDTML